jgi:hypothetical protein
VRSGVMRECIELMRKLERDITTKDGKVALLIAIGILRAKRDVYEKGGE